MWMFLQIGMSQNPCFPIFPYSTWQSEMIEELTSPIWGTPSWNSTMQYEPSSTLGSNVDLAHVFPVWRGGIFWPTPVPSSTHFKRCIGFTWCLVEGWLIGLLKTLLLGVGGCHSDRCLELSSNQCWLNPYSIPTYIIYLFWWNLLNPHVLLFLSPNRLIWYWLHVCGKPNAITIPNITILMGGRDLSPKGRLIIGFTTLCNLISGWFLPSPQKPC